jgi:hypothetical protein
LHHGQYARQDHGKFEFNTYNNVIMLMNVAHLGTLRIMSLSFNSIPFQLAVLRCVAGALGFFTAGGAC